MNICSRSEQKAACVMDATSAVVSLGPQEVALLQNGSHTGIAFHYPNGNYVCRLKPKINPQEEPYQGNYNSVKRGVKGGMEFPYCRNNSPQSLLQYDQFSDSCSSTSDNYKVPSNNYYKCKSFEHTRCMGEKSNNYYSCKSFEHVRSSMGEKANSYLDETYEESGIYDEAAYDYFPNNCTQTIDYQMVNHQQLIQQQQKWLMQKMTPNTSNSKVQAQIQNLGPQIFLDENWERPTKTQNKQKQNSLVTKLFSSKSTSNSLGRKNSNSNSSSQKQSKVSGRNGLNFASKYFYGKDSHSFSQRVFKVFGEKNLQDQQQKKQCQKEKFNGNSKNVDFVASDITYAMEELWKQPTVILKPWY